MKKPRLDRLVPVEISAAKEAGYLALGLAAAGLYSLRFVISFLNARSALYVVKNRVRLLDTDAIMPPFADLLDGSLAGFAILALGMVFLAVWHYAKHYMGGSRSIYLMRRLPDRFELHRRCLFMPVAAAVLCAVCAFALLLIYYVIYMSFTPEPCLAAGQWAAIWRN